MNSPDLLDVITHEPTNGDDAGANNSEDSARRGVRLWGLLLTLVIIFGYLTASRRKALSTFVEQVMDIVRDFRGYDPEF